MENLKELKKQTIKKLEELREEIPNKIDEENYCDIINTLIDYDNEAHDSLYLHDYSMDVIEFVNEEILEYLINQNKDSLSRLRCFIGDTYDANIYKLNVYGNLENVTDDDFRDVIDYAIDRLKESEDN